jgi:hypothetical protein
VRARGGWSGLGAVDRREFLEIRAILCVLTGQGEDMLST